jgi:hemolysin D
MLGQLARHAEVAGESWKQDRRLAKQRTAWRETEFLPAALEVLETPPNPLGRAVLLILMLFVTIAIVWSIIGKVDVVASASGKIIPEGRVKVIQPVELGVVRAIYVREGSQVEAGQALIELDPTVSQAELAQAQQGLLAARIDRARAQALADFAAGKPAEFIAPEGAAPDLAELQNMLVAARVREHRTARAALTEELTQRRSDASMVSSELQKLTQQLPLAEQQLTGLKTLEERGLAPKMRVMELEERVIGIRQDLAIRSEETSKSQAAVAGVQQQVARLDSEFAREALDALTESDAAVRLREEELKKAEDKTRNTVLASPIAGTVQQLTVSTLGGVVKPADPLMVIVPRVGECPEPAPGEARAYCGERLIAEAMASNKDVGFLAVGQDVEVKLEAYPFTRYGVVPGRLIAVSQDAVENDKGDLNFPVRVELFRDHITVNGEARRLAPGLAATAEIKTGRRRIIDFLLSPLARRMEEAGRER